MKCPSPDMECTQTVIHTTSNFVPLDEQVRMERRAHAFAKSVRRQLRRDRKEGSLLDSVEKGVFHVCSASGRGESPSDSMIRFNANSLL